MKRNTIRRITLGIVTAAALALAAGLGVAAAAPGVTPQTFSATLNPGDSVVVPKVVHTQPIPPKPDIYLLADSTGSMGPAIANVKANAGAITGAMFGAGDYKDFQRPQFDPYVFHNGASIGTAASAITAINAWTAPSG